MPFYFFYLCDFILILSCFTIIIIIEMRKICFFLLFLFFVIGFYNCSSGISEDLLQQDEGFFDEITVEKVEQTEGTRSTVSDSFYYLVGSVVMCGSNEPIIGCSIAIKFHDGSTFYTVTDIDGNYLIILPVEWQGSNTIVTFSFIGMESKSFYLPSLIYPGQIHYLAPICLEDDSGTP